MKHYVFYACNLAEVLEEKNNKYFIDRCIYPYSPIRSWVKKKNCFEIDNEVIAISYYFEHYFRRYNTIIGINISNTNLSQQTTKLWKLACLNKNDKERVYGYMDEFHKIFSKALEKYKKI